MKKKFLLSDKVQFLTDSIFRIVNKTGEVLVSSTKVDNTL